MKKLLLGTRKGLVVCEKQNNQWKITATHFTGIPVSMVYTDKDTATWWACLDHGHWGVKLHKSVDEGKNWEEIPAPVYPEGTMVNDEKEASLRYIWSFEKVNDVLLVGTDPGGLFESADNGKSFQLNTGLWNHPSRKENWFGGGRDLPGIHSICIDPNDGNHAYIAISCAGVFETKDAGETWHPKNKGLKADFLPDPDAEVGQDPHLLVMHPKHPEIMWQQNHCGIFKTENGGEQWQEISEKEGPANFGFAIELNPDNEKMAWVAPAHSDGIRVAIDGKLQICRTTDGGKTWESFSNGLPQEHCFDIVYRHCLKYNGEDLIFGTTTGNLFVSNDLGENWQCISNYLPMIYCVHFE